jgi:multicomponent Na+:H+ antiporter subunit G
MPIDAIWPAASWVADAATVVLVLIGCVFFLAGTVGLLRFPDVYCRLHALTKADTLGLGFIAAGLMLQSQHWSTGALLLLIWGLALGAAATVCHLLARASLHAGIRPVRHIGGSTKEGN